MLQQTRVEVVIPYFEMWMVRFPTVVELAAANIDELLALWQGLGYYTRCRNLLLGAQFVAQFGWPKSAKEWRTIPGVGDYTAAAVASICNGEPVAVVDGNVERVYARINRSEETRTKLRAAAGKWAQENLGSADPGVYNQALMELGATICTPMRPQCLICPVQAECKALAEGNPTDYPRSEPKPKPLELRWRIVIPECKSKLGFQQLTESRWWKAMWAFPTFAASEPAPEESIRLGTVKHTVTKHRLICEVEFIRLHKATKDLIWLTREEIEAKALPSLYRKALFLAQGLY